MQQSNYVITKEVDEVVHGLTTDNYLNIGLIRGLSLCATTPQQKEKFRAYFTSIRDAANMILNQPDMKIEEVVEDIIEEIN